VERQTPIVERIQNRKVATHHSALRRRNQCWGFDHQCGHCNRGHQRWKLIAVCFVPDDALHGTQWKGAEDPGHGEQGGGAMGCTVVLKLGCVHRIPVGFEKWWNHIRCPDHAFWSNHLHRLASHSLPPSYRLCANLCHRGTIEVVHIRFRNGLKAQGQSVDNLPFKAMWYPYGTYAALAANIFLIFFQGYTAFLNPFSATNFVINYILLPVFVILLVGYKIWRNTKLVKLEEMDIWTGRRVDGLGARDKEMSPERYGVIYRARRMAVG